MSPIDGSVPWTVSVLYEPSPKLLAHAIKSWVPAVGMVLEDCDATHLVAVEDLGGGVALLESLHQDSACVEAYWSRVCVDVLLIGLLEYLGIIANAGPKRLREIVLELNLDLNQSMTIYAFEGGLVLGLCLIGGGWKGNPMATLGVERMSRWMSSLTSLEIVSMASVEEEPYSFPRAPWAEVNAVASAEGPPLELLVRPVDPVTPVTFSIERPRQLVVVSFIVEVFGSESDPDAGMGWQPIPGWSYLTSEGPLRCEFREDRMVVPNLDESVPLEPPDEPRDPACPRLGVVVSADARGRPVRLRVQLLGEGQCALRLVACQQRSDVAGVFDRRGSPTAEEWGERAEALWERVSSATAPLIERFTRQDWEEEGPNAS